MAVKPKCLTNETWQGLSITLTLSQTSPFVLLVTPLYF